MSHIFVSYSRKNSECVYRVVDKLKQLDFPVWIDLESIEITSEWLNEIENNIKSATVFMLFWSKQASESNYVEHEIRIAKKLSVEKKINILVMMLDDTELPFDHIQAFDMRDNCSALAITNFINTIKIDSTLVRETQTTKSYIHSPLGLVPSKPKDLVVILQFLRDVDDEILDSVKVSLPDQKWVLQIMGPNEDGKFKLDNDKPEMWKACREDAVKAIDKLSTKGITTLHFITLTPNALFGGITMPFYRFWHVKFYNYVAGKYVLVDEIPLD